METKKMAIWNNYKKLMLEKRKDLNEEEVDENPSLLGEPPIVSVGLCKKEKLNPHTINKELQKIDEDLIKFETNLLPGT